MNIALSASTTPADLDNRCREAGRTFLFDRDDPPTSEYAHFYFTGVHDGSKVIFNVTLYTLRLMYESELYAEAEHRALERFPEHAEKISAWNEAFSSEEEPPDLSEPEMEKVGLFMAEVVMELEEDNSIMVQEHAEVHFDDDVGVGLDVALHVEEVNTRVIEEFVRSYREDTLRLDPVQYSFPSGDRQQEEDS